MSEGLTVTTVGSVTDVPVFSENTRADESENASKGAGWMWIVCPSQSTLGCTMGVMSDLETQ